MNRKTWFLTLLLVLSGALYNCSEAENNTEETSGISGGNDNNGEESEDNDGDGDTGAIEEAIVPWDTEIPYAAWGKPDTLACYPIGPGVDYIAINYEKAPLRVFVTRVDLTNPENDIEHFQLDIPSTGYAVSKQCELNWDLYGKRVVSAANHDFFYGSAGGYVPMGSNVRNGQVTHANYLNTSKGNIQVLAFDQEKQPKVFHATLKMRVFFENGKSLPLDRTNLRWYTGNTIPADELDKIEAVFFNAHYDYPAYENTTNLDGTFVEVRPLEEFTTNNADGTRCEILRIADEKIPMTGISTEGSLQERKNYMLVFRGSKQTNFKSYGIQVGEEVRIRNYYDFSDADCWGEAPENVRQAFEAYPAILRDGQYYSESNWCVDHLTQQQPRTAAGISKDEKTFYLVAVDGRSQSSRGVNTEELAGFFRSFGCDFAVNFDGGGSTEMVIREGLDKDDFRIVNTPSDGKERSVMNTIQVISKVEADTRIAGYTFLRPSLEVPENTKTALPEILAVNRHGEILNRNVPKSDFTWRCVPEGFASIQQGEITTSGIAEYGYLYAEKAGYASFRLKIKSIR